MHDCLSELVETDPWESEVVELRFFGGLNVEETAEVPGVAIQTAMRAWETAKVCLLHHLEHGKYAATPRAT